MTKPVHAACLPPPLLLAASSHSGLVPGSHHKVERTEKESERGERLPKRIIRQTTHLFLFWWPCLRLPVRIRQPSHCTAAANDVPAAGSDATTDASPIAIKEHRETKRKFSNRRYLKIIHKIFKMRLTFADALSPSRAPSLQSAGASPLSVDILCVSTG